MTSLKKSSSFDQSQKLFERGWIYLKQQPPLPVEVTRGMAILTREKQEAGQVAAVVVDNASQQVTHVLLTRPRLRPEYRLVPVDLIDQVDEAAVLLDICQQAIDSLPPR